MADRMSGVYAVEAEMIEAADTLHVWDVISGEDAADLAMDIRAACRDYADLVDYATLADLRDDLRRMVRAAHV